MREMARAQTRATLVRQVFKQGCLALRADLLGTSLGRDTLDEFVLEAYSSPKK